MAGAAHATERPGVATRARGDDLRSPDRYCRRPLAAIRQVMAIATEPTQRPGVATRARGDVVSPTWGSRLAAIRQVMADAHAAQARRTERPRPRDL
jgi:hypothetical protein